MFANTFRNPKANAFKDTLQTRSSKATPKVDQAT